MRPQTSVIYELNLINMEGEELTETFTKSFDSEIYNNDVDGTDSMIVNFKVQDLQRERGGIFLLGFSVERISGTVH